MKHSTLAVSGNPISTVPSSAVTNSLSDKARAITALACCSVSSNPPHHTTAQGGQIGRVSRARVNGLANLRAQRSAAVASSRKSRIEREPARRPAASWRIIRQSPVSQGHHASVGEVVVEPIDRSGLLSTDDGGAVETSETRVWLRAAGAAMAAAYGQARLTVIHADMPQVAATFWADECHAVHETGLGLLAAAAIVVDDCLVGEVGTATGAAGFECQQAIDAQWSQAYARMKWRRLQQTPASEAFQRDPLSAGGTLSAGSRSRWRAGVKQASSGCRGTRPGEDQQVAAVLPCGAERQRDSRRMTGVN